MLKFKRLSKVVSIALVFTFLFSSNVFADTYFHQETIGIGALVSGDVDVQLKTGTANGRYVNASTGFIGKYATYNNTTVKVSLIVKDATTNKQLYSGSNQGVWTSNSSADLTFVSVYSGILTVTNGAALKGATATSTHTLTGPISFSRTLTETY